MTNTNKNKIDDIVLDLAVLDLVTEIEPQHKLLDDIGMDSLDKVELIMEVESQFDITIADDKIEEIDTIQDLYDAVQEKVK